MGKRNKKVNYQKFKPKIQTNDLKNHVYKLKKAACIVSGCTHHTG